MKRLNWQITLGITLLALSAACYGLHYLIFKDAHHIFIYLVGDIAFVFIEVLLVTLIIHRILEDRAKKARLEKLNMVIGAFFSEVGTKLLNILSRHDPQIEKIQTKLTGENESAEQKFEIICKCLRKHNYDIKNDSRDWVTMRDFLEKRRNFLLRMLENPTLLEHESFVLVLWAVFHLSEELEARDCLDDLPDTDHRHLEIDVNRVYGQLATQWLKYMEHLKDSYPYLFSLSLRTNPFDRNANPVVR